MVFKGSAVALVTPFDKQGKVNYFSLKSLIDYQLANGTNAIVILGTTGESSTISFEEREKIIKFSISLTKGKIPIIVGTGSNSTQTSIALTKQAEDLGADAVLVVTPYYNKCNQEGLFKHYTQIASATSLPIILYNVPSRTSVNIQPETVIKLSKIKNIVGIKEASGNMAQIAEICQKKPSKFSLYSGDDILSLPMFSMGASGIISVTANAYPEQIAYLASYALNGDYYNALKMHNKLYNINKALFLDVNPICIKHYLNLLGFSVGKPRLPLTEANPELKKKLLEVKNLYEN